MRIDPEARTAAFSAREFATFRVVPERQGGPHERWRAEAGRRWHETVQRSAGTREGTIRTEVPIEAVLRAGRWTLRLGGRIDLVEDAGVNGPILTEIKTMLRPLPLPEETLRRDYPEHFIQLAAYLRLASLLPDWGPCQGQLLFIEVETGIRQSVDYDPGSDTRAFDLQLETVAAFLDRQLDAARIRRTFSFPTLLDTARPGQKEAVEDLRRGALRQPRLAFQAPTGFGKTRIALEHGLESLRSGRIDRILYLTGKTTGQIQVVEEFNRLRPADAPFPGCYRMRNRGEHHQVCALDGCRPGGCDPRAAAPDPEVEREILATPGSPGETWAAVVRLAEVVPTCPYALSRALLPFADLWIGDFNYLFSPGARGVFAEASGFDPGRTLLVIDEAHNLAARVDSNLAVTPDPGRLGHLAAELRDRGFNRTLLRPILDAAAIVEDFAEEKVARETACLLLAEAATAWEEGRDGSPLPYEEIGAPSLAALDELRAMAWLGARPGLEPFLIRNGRRGARLVALAPEPWIAECLEPFAEILALSATLGPVEHLAREWGLSPGSFRPVAGFHPELARQYDIAIDTRVTTTLRERGKHYAATARTIAATAGGVTGCVAVFFPSFAYAEAVGEYLGVEFPGLIARLQPRELDLEEQEAFLRDAPRQSDVLLLVLGGRFAEGVDAFGGSVGTAIIVGPGLPEMDDIVRERMARHGGDREAGFHHVCRIPGMRRVNQAIGRFVRGPDDHARILLHDRRFAEPPYRDQLNPEFGEASVIRGDRDFEAWISGKPTG